MGTTKRLNDRTEPREPEARKATGRTSKRPKSVGDPIEGFRKAWEQWEALGTGCHLGVTARTPDGRTLVVAYELPDNREMKGDATEQAKFGMVPVPWANLLHPAARPTDPEWRAAYDAIAKARKLLANAADNLGKALPGDGDEARYLRTLAANLASRLRTALWVWRTEDEVTAAKDIERGLERYMREVADEARQVEEAKKRAAEQAEASELHEANLRWIAWTKNLPAPAGKREPTALDVVNDPRCKAVVLILTSKPKVGPDIAKDQRCECSYSTLRDVVLPAMTDRGMIEQTRPRGPYRLVSTKPTK